MFTSIVFLALVGTAFGDLVDFHPCEGNINPPQVVSIDGCSGYQCSLTMGQTINLSVEFVSPVDAKTVNAYEMLGSRSKTSLACGKGLNCPLTKGQYYVHQHQVQVTSYSKSAKEIYYRLQTIKGDPIVCFTYPVSVE